MAGYRGGGIYSTGDVTATDSTISSNKADYGGGIYSTGNVTVEEDSTILDNEATDKGGGIRVYGGDVTVTDSTISGNSAKDGGGIASNRDVTVIDSTISNNIVSGTDSDGGGIYSTGNVTATDSNILSNKAGYRGGGIYSDGDVTATDSNILSNEAGYGGGIYSKGDVTVTDSEISSNEATDKGGGVRIWGAGNDLELSGYVTIENNKASTGAQWNVEPGTVTADGTTLPNTDGNDYRGPNRLQSITFDPLADKTYGDVPFTISASADSGLDVTFASATTGVCTVSKTTPNNAEVTILAAGTCTINADQSGGTSKGVTYAPATSVQQSFNITSSGGSVINPDPDMQIRNGDSTAAETITSGGLEPLRYGTFKRGQTVPSPWTSSSETPVHRC